ncbi:class I SAM-dependent methyltransferase [Saccharopolyspora shandongensis]|uniref:class I SAM-dependent methyltransferase n=1 Tax=Saccharopolyspora shandongensis TaxID=418495 RepID=UPI00340C7F71
MTEASYLSSTRAGYDALAVEYAERAKNELAERPFGRAMLGTFAELVDGGPVVDVGCGTGMATGYLASLGVNVRGIDLSPGMLAEARRCHPDLRFDEGSMAALDLPDGELAGLVAWYSIIHIPPAQVPGVLAEFHRVLAPGGHLLLAFQFGEEDDLLHLTEGWGHVFDLDFHRWTPARLADPLKAAGFAMSAALEREADDTERTAQAHVIARKL